MRRSSKQRKRALRYGQAVLLGVQIECEKHGPYGKPQWFVRIPGWEPRCGPWLSLHVAVNVALDRLEVLPVTHEALAAAKIAFQTAPQPATAAQYMTLLRQAEAADLIDDDDWLDGLAAINEYLHAGGSVVTG